MIRQANINDADAIADIYNYYVANTSITFEEHAVSAEDMRGRITDVTENARLPWLVEEQHGLVIGYAYATKWRARSAYRFSVESSVYLSNDHRGEGIGRKLYASLLESLRAAGIHCVIGGIALPNGASVALHEKSGFRKVAHFEEVGYKFGRWIDVGYWQQSLDELRA